MNKYILLIFFLLIACFSFAQVNLQKFPKNLQLYQRELNNYAEIPITGSANHCFVDSVFLKIYQNDTLLYTLNKDLNMPDSLFNFEVSLEAKMKNYKFELLTKSVGSSLKVLFKTADKVLVGEGILLYGQSNMVAYNGVEEFNALYSDEFFRNFSYNIYTLSYAWNYGKAPVYDVGTVGNFIAKYLNDSLKIPVLIINASIGGANIEFLQNRTATNKFNLATAYGKLLSRLKESGMLNKIRIMAYNQGEADANNWNPTCNSYPSFFNNFYQNLLTDVPSLETIYLCQTNILTNTTPIQRAGYVRDFQRRAETIYHKVQIISLSGLAIYDGVHYGKESYIDMAKDIFYKIKRDHFAANNNINYTSPKIQYAYYSPNKDSVTLVFNKDQKLALENIYEYPDRTMLMKDMFSFSNDTSGLLYIPYYNQVNSYSYNDNIIKLKLNNNTAGAKFISYLPSTFVGDVPNRFVGPVIRNTAGEAAFTFYDMPILNGPQEVNMLQNFRKILNLKAAGKNQSTIVLNWDKNLANIDSIIIESSLDSVNFKHLKTIANTNATEVINLIDNQLYYFRIKTLNVNGFSDYVCSKKASTFKTKNKCNKIDLGQNIINKNLIIEAKELKLNANVNALSRLKIKANFIEMHPGTNIALGNYLLITPTDSVCF
jgi:hypothetical protein